MNSVTVVAFHEAGHAVAAYVLRRRINLVTIVGGDGHNGRVSLTELAPRHLKRRERDVVIGLAGVPAERRLLGGKHDPRGFENDRLGVLKTLRDTAMRRGEDPELLLESRVQAALKEAKSIVNEHWPAVESLADELLRRRTLSGRAVRKLLAESIPNEKRMGTNGH
jgi:ATP-dependent Zn protease